MFQRTKYKQHQLLTTEGVDTLVEQLKQLKLFLLKDDKLEIEDDKQCLSEIEETVDNYFAKQQPKPTKEKQVLETVTEEASLSLRDPIIEDLDLYNIEKLYEIAEKIEKEPESTNRPNHPR